MTVAIAIDPKIRDSITSDPETWADAVLSLAENSDQKIGLVRMMYRHDFADGSCVVCAVGGMSMILALEHAGEHEEIADILDVAADEVYDFETGFMFPDWEETGDTPAALAGIRLRKTAEERGLMGAE